jgi:hypothetical protein
VESAPGAGATFRIELPMEQKNAAQSETPADERPADPPVFTAA